jgi:chromosomal replication initiation ATPase DnaA
MTPIDSPQQTNMHKPQQQLADSIRGAIENSLDAEQVAAWIMQAVARAFGISVDEMLGGGRRNPRRLMAAHISAAYCYRLTSLSNAEVATMHGWADHCSTNAARKRAATVEWFEDVAVAAQVKGVAL